MGILFTYIRYIFRLTRLKYCRIIDIKHISIIPLVKIKHISIIPLIKIKHISIIPLIYIRYLNYSLDCGINECIKFKPIVALINL